MFKNMFEKVQKCSKISKKVDNAICPIKKVDNDAICPINVLFTFIIFLDKPGSYTGRLFKFRTNIVIIGPRMIFYYREM